MKRLLLIAAIGVIGCADSSLPYSELNERCNHKWGKFETAERWSNGVDVTLYQSRSCDVCGKTQRVRMDE